MRKSTLVSIESLPTLSLSMFKVADLADSGYRVMFDQLLHANRLIRLELLELELALTQPKLVELRRKESTPWERYLLESSVRKGEVKLEHENEHAPRTN